MGQVSEAQQELQDTQDAAGVLQVAAERAGAGPGAGAGERGRDPEVDNMVPPTADLSGMILLLRNSASVAGVQVLSLTPAPARPLRDERLLEHLGVRERRGSYFAVVKYLNEIETLPRAATVQSVNLSPTEGTSPLVRRDDHAVHERRERRARIRARSDRDRGCRGSLRWRCPNAIVAPSRSAGSSSASCWPATCCSRSSAEATSRPSRRRPSPRGRARRARPRSPADRRSRASPGGTPSPSRPPCRRRPRRRPPTAGATATGPLAHERRGRERRRER